MPRLYAVLIDLVYQISNKLSSSSIPTVVMFQSYSYSSKNFGFISLYFYKSKETDCRLLKVFSQVLNIMQPTCLKIENILHINYTQYLHVDIRSIYLLSSFFFILIRVFSPNVLNLTIKIHYIYLIDISFLMNTRFITRITK